ncbi:MAG TPA: rod shape-determining protein [Syntrophorhabdus sp.]|jgi:rod shape-determining protein MreB|nr:rod shape-determining protein [Syntrophorhabdus sp.]MDI9556965.1 rod shape-determining protein [Pseudomonadota bacterium]OPX99924.1 MAG: Rod shape-determining protein MreB [Syntrophorhabdus sp. PtaB.Bin027]OQB77107.1 MAG: Rod shape-determining protein MreB [Deltaproteobacteria bacterium ADurb.Bin135]MBP8744224.1 rod shape-determining protein [Syntrophorhabdus sp.]
MDFFRKLFGLFSTHFAMDLGTANTLIYMKGEGIILNEPSVVAIDNTSGKVIAVGREAKDYIGRTPPNISAIRPLKDGVIADFDVTKAMIKYFLTVVRKDRKIQKPKMVVGVPSGITMVEKKAVVDACFQVGIRDTYLVEEPMAAAIGSEMPIELPRGNMVVDIGGGTTEVAIISLAATAYSESLRVAGDEVDESIVRYLQKKHQIAIGAIAAERLKLDGASVYPAEGRGNAFSVVGKDLLTGVPKNLRITSEEIREAIEEPVSAIIDAIRRALEKLPPEFASDLNESGMVLTGGGALLGGLDHRIEKETGINVYVADDPLLSVVLGAGKALEDMARYRKVFIN